ncbi:pre-RNA processing PIH1/Nop17-domain-containing protein [Armillaria novae-zelandiae]|uniref:Pre-RNA processing PIH1/Nop17-domain-containing protein n=1 Tax=Armillaria novae-zelandiae TaxID=153914 RepID=A0AA39UH75_9AGAR|nr:pre-RNA processing PIH1/Nop17-domain-containing protein [Armillaria novae-zelandiae]
MLPPSTTKRATLSPQAGFCVKSTTNGIKVFINIAWDATVPAPPAAAADVIQRAMQGADSGWYVPVVVSEPRSDTDKAGKSSLVVDCIYNKSLKARVLRDPAWKTFLIELALQRIEAQTALVLSRHIGTPNIASKGKLAPREVTLPDLPKPTEKKALIEEVTTWAWSTSSQPDRIHIRIAVPALTRALIPATALDLEPRRLILAVPSQPSVDIDLAASDAELASRHSTSDAIALKRQRPFNVHEATAEWLVSEGVLVVHA